MASARAQKAGLAERHPSHDAAPASSVRRNASSHSCASRPEPRVIEEFYLDRDDIALSSLVPCHLAADGHANTVAPQLLGALRSASPYAPTGSMSRYLRGAGRVHRCSLRNAAAKRPDNSRPSTAFEDGAMAIHRPLKANGDVPERRLTVCSAGRAVGRLRYGLRPRRAPPPAGFPSRSSGCGSSANGSRGATSSPGSTPADWGQAASPPRLTADRRA